MQPTPNATATYEAMMREVQGLMFQQGLNTTEQLLPLLLVAVGLSLLFLVFMVWLILRNRNKVRRR